MLLTAIARRLAGVSAIKCDSEHSQVGGRRAHRLGAFEVLSQSGGLVWDFKSYNVAISALHLSAINYRMHLLSSLPAHCLSAWVPSVERRELSPDQKTFLSFPKFLKTFQVKRCLIEKSRPKEPEKGAYWWGSFGNCKVERLLGLPEWTESIPEWLLVNGCRSSLAGRWLWIATVSGSYLLDA